MPAGQQYSSVTWMVKPDREDDFVACWRDLADWTLETCSGAITLRLLKDDSTPRKYVSFGEWADDAAIAAWRREDEFQRKFGSCRACCEYLDASDLTLAALVERQPVA
jgi:heme-degrading monooxygenase HmoA